MDHDGCANPSQFSAATRSCRGTARSTRAHRRQEARCCPHLVSRIGTALGECTIAEMVRLAEIGASARHVRRTAMTATASVATWRTQTAANVRCAAGRLPVAVQTDEREVRRARPYTAPLLTYPAMLSRALATIDSVHMLSPPYAIAAVHSDPAIR